MAPIAIISKDNNASAIKPGPGTGLAPTTIVATAVSQAFSSGDELGGNAQIWYGTE